MADELKACANTDRELWRETEGDYYAPSIHVTEQGAIGINVGGTVIVRSVRDWHGLATRIEPEAADRGVSEAEVERVARAIDEALPESDHLTLAPSQIKRAARAAIQSLRSEQEGS